MPPVKDIRSFFKPATKSETEVSPKGPQDSRAPAAWSSQEQGTRRLDAPTRSTKDEQTHTPATGARIQSTTLSRESTAFRPVSNSQSSMHSTGSKKAIQNGEQVILNSDSDSDLDQYDELDLFLSKPPSQNNTSDGSKLLSRSSEMPVTTRSYMRAKPDGLRKPPKITNTARSSLSTLVKAVKRDAEKEAKIAAWKAELEKPDEVTLKREATIDEEFLANAVDGGEGGDKSKRLYLAMQRTNALDEDCVFHFLGEPAEKDRTGRTPFPIGKFPRHGWATCFEDAHTRDQLFLSGFAKKVFESQVLPEELSSWVIDQVCSGRNEGLTPKYLEFIEAHPVHLGNILNKLKLNTMFAELGGNVECVDRKVKPTYEILQTPKRPIPSQLQSVVQLLQSVAKWLLPDSRRHALLLLLHLCFDDSILANARILRSVQEAIDSLMRYIPDRDSMLDDIVQSLLDRISNPILQNLLITSLPLKSPMTASFRRHLALSFIIHPTPLPAAAANTNIASLIHDTLDNSRHFKINRDTKYNSLAASVSLLDIAIGPGLTEVPCRPPPIEGDSLPKQLSAEEAAFNKQIDMLVQHIRLLGNNIVEAGAISDPARLVAKGNMEALCHRLENAARIGGRKKKRIFEDEDAEYQVQASKRIFGKWMGRKKEVRSAAPRIVITRETEVMKQGENAEVHVVSGETVAGKNESVLPSRPAVDGGSTGVKTDET